MTGEVYIILFPFLFSTSRIFISYRLPVQNINYNNTLDFSHGIIRDTDRVIKFSSFNMQFSGAMSIVAE